MHYNMIHFVNFGIVKNIKNSSVKQRLGLGAGLLGLAAAGGYAGYRALKGEPLDLGGIQASVVTPPEDFDEGGFDFKDIPQNLRGGSATPLKEWTEDRFGNPVSSYPQAERMGMGTDIYQNLRGTVEKVYRDRPNTPRENVYDAIRYPDLRGQQFAETGERIKTVAGNLGKGIQSGIGNTYNYLKENVRPDFRENFRIKPEEYLSGKYKLDDLSSKDLLNIYKQVQGREGAEAILDKAIARRGLGL